VPYPWEEPLAEQPASWQESLLRPVLEACLSRDAAQRPSAWAGRLHARALSAWRSGALNAVPPSVGYEGTDQAQC
jgi:hypothetical protein